MDAKKKTAIKPQDADMFLKKHVGLIHCENKLTLIQRKICNILLFNALDKINDNDIYEISLKHLCSLIGYNSNDINLIKESIKSLISVVMEWNLLEDSKFLNEGNISDDIITWNASALLAGASIRSGVVRYSYSPQMKSVLSSLDIYGRINLFVQAKFNSTYSLVLYENCIRFKNLKQTAWFPIDLFRSLMGVSGDKYPSFKEFKRNVITVAVNEINQKADIFIEPQYKKLGRNIAAIQFVLTENDSYRPSFKKLPGNTITPPDISAEKRMLMELLLSEFRLSKKQAEAIITEYDYDYIMEKTHLVKAKNNIDHPGAYLVSALKKDYQAKQNPTLHAKNSAPDNSYIRESRAASEIMSLKNKYTSYRLDTYLRFISQQPEDMQKTITEKFERYLQPKGEIYRHYKKKGLSSSFINVDFMRFIDEHFPYVVGEYLSFDDYLTAD